MASTNAPALAERLMLAALAAQQVGLDGDSETEAFITVELRLPLSVLLALQAYPGYADVLLPEEFCRECGCTNNAGCEGGCYWVGPHLCSACVPRVPLLIRQASEVVG